MNKKIKIFLASAALCALVITSSTLYYFRQPDITIIGPVAEADGLGRNTIDFIKMLSNNYYVNCRPTSLIKKEIGNQVKKVIDYPKTKFGKVVIVTQPLWTPQTQNNKLYKQLAKRQDSIKVAYSMFESSLIPVEWVDILNENFDIVVVPDDYLAKVYRNSGVTIPIRTLPLAIDFTSLVKKPLKTETKNPFVFTILSSGLHRKNILGPVKAFARLFANRDDVILRINSRYSLDGTNKEIKAFIKNLGINNILMSERALTRKQYNCLLENSDCLINASMGEGFSIQPREAMTLGIPCIVSDNTAQSTICQSGLVKSISLHEKEPALHFFSDLPYGYYFRCDQEELTQALWDMYKNHSSYLAKSHDMRQWAFQYDISQMTPRYIEFFNPDNLKQIVPRLNKK